MKLGKDWVSYDFRFIIRMDVIKFDIKSIGECDYLSSVCYRFLLGLWKLNGFVIEF